MRRNGLDAFLQDLRDMVSCEAIERDLKSSDNNDRTLHKDAEDNLVNDLDADLDADLDLIADSFSNASGLSIGRESGRNNNEKTAETAPQN